MNIPPRAHSGWRSWPALGALLCLAVAATTLPAAEAPAPARAGRPDPSAALFAGSFIPHLRIEITASNLARLRRNDRNYVPVTVREGTNVWEDVGVHVKGAAGSRRGVDDLPALSVNFDKYVHDQKFHGLDKFHLNNSVQDASRLCEAICAKLFLEAGVPASRVTHARVTFNGRDLGLYVLKEGFDKTFLRRHFRNPNGNLYDGGFLTEINPGLERTSGNGDVRNGADLKALVDAAQDTNPTNRLARLERLLDLDKFLSFLALEVITWHWDGYLMKPNNYRVYHDPDTDKITLFPHGMDQMFWDANGPLLPNPQGLLARAVLQTPEGRRRYKARLASLTTNFFTAERMTNFIGSIQERLQPVLLAWNKNEAKRQSDDALRIQKLVLERIKGLERKLAEPEPKPLAFDASGVAAVRHWEPPRSPNLPPAILDRPVLAGGVKTLHIGTAPNTNCIGSFRAAVLLEAGTYVLEGRVRTAGVVPWAADKAKKGDGAGLRVSRAAAARPNQLLGDQSWQQMEYEFNVPAGPDEVVLICELRAGAGEAWFDLDSLKLRRR